MSMSLKLELPDRLRERIQQSAAKENLTVEEFALKAIEGGLSGYEQMQYLKARAKGADWKKFQEAMSKVPDVAPIPGDELPEGWTDKSNKH